MVVLTCDLVRMQITVVTYSHVGQFVPAEDLYPHLSLISHSWLFLGQADHCLMGWL